MKDLVWGKILSVGVDEIDEDHRKLIQLFNLNYSITPFQEPNKAPAT